MPPKSRSTKRVTVVTPPAVTREASVDVGPTQLDASQVVQLSQALVAVPQTPPASPPRAPAVVARGPAADAVLHDDAAAPEDTANAAQQQGAAFDPLDYFTAPVKRFGYAATAAATPSALFVPATDTGVLVPNPANIDATFYRSRRGALRERAYDADAHPAEPETLAALVPTQTDGVARPATDRLVSVATDVSRGGGAKLYNVLARGAVLPFIADLAPTRRNLYVVIDPALPLDPYFDIDRRVADADFPAGPARDPTMDIETHKLRVDAARREWFMALKLRTLHHALLFAILPALEGYFGGPAASCAVFDASSFARSKISFHVHVRMRDGKAFRNMREAKVFAATRLGSLATVQAAATAAVADAVTAFHSKGPTMRRGGPKAHRPENEPDAVAPLPEDYVRRTILNITQGAIDGGVYTAWRLFRLPFCCKRDRDGSNGPSLEIFAASDVPTHGADVFSSLDAETFGALQGVNVEARATAALDDMRIVAARLRALLLRLAPNPTPGVPPPPPAVAQLAGTTTAAADAVAAVAFDMALVTRHDASSALTFTAVALTADDDATHGDGDDAAAPDGDAGAAHASSGGGVRWLRPIRDGVRVPVTDDRCNILLQLFQAIDKHYDPTSSESYSVGGGVQALTRCEYEDGGMIRSYYVQQKQCKWCYKLQRPHASTYGQLFVTYGSIKYRCYSNDCHATCAHIPWDPAWLPLRDALLPELSLSERRVRYPETFAAAVARASGEQRAEDDGVASAADDDAIEALLDADAAAEDDALRSTADAAGRVTLSTRLEALLHA